MIIKLVKVAAPVTGVITMGEPICPAATVGAVNIDDDIATFENGGSHLLANQTPPFESEPDTSTWYDAEAYRSKALSTLG